MFILGRPAGGKSELIDFMKKNGDADRTDKYHIGRFEEVDDFKWLAELFEEDDRRESRGEKRIHSTPGKGGYNLLDPKLRGKLIPRFNKTISEKYLGRPKFYDTGTVMIEFARGIGDGFKYSLDQFDPSILKDSAIIYIDVSFLESVRKNDARYLEAQKNSILFHKVPDEDMHGFFKDNDWKEITANKPSGYLLLNGIDVPFVTMNNEPELTENSLLERRYKQAFDALWKLYERRK